jgi:hypothetical protein
VEAMMALSLAQTVQIRPRQQGIWVGVGGDERSNGSWAVVMTRLAPHQKAQIRRFHLEVADIKLLTSPTSRGVGHRCTSNGNTGIP